VLARQAADDEREREQRIAADATFLSAWELAEQIAPLLGTAPGTVFNALTHVPDNMLGLLCSPEGWSALAKFSAGFLNRASIDFTPTLH
jgi:hypothetical protein